MSTVLFFPWLTIDSEFVVGDFELLAYVRGKEPFGANSEKQEQVDKILSSFLVRGGTPVEEATLLKFRDKNPLDDLSDEESTAALVFGELIAISGLSAREFFWLGAFQYSNRDLFQLRIQSFEGEVNGIKLRSRRRDGPTLSYVSLDAYKIHKPHHIVEPLQVEFDIGLLQALLDARSQSSHGTWAQYYESIINFNHASREAAETPLHVELVFTSAAFERLLGLGRGKEAELASAFVQALQPEEDLELDLCERLSEKQLEERGSETLRDLWIRDFYRLRGKLAHGQVDSQYPSIWSTEEHLLLASFVYPLVLKSCLESDGYYKMTDDDHLKINIFEELACAEHYGPNQTEEGERYAWNEIKGRARFARLFENARMVDPDDEQN